MLIYPTIELQARRCVSLFRGRLEEPQVWHVDPIAKAREFAAAGAEWLHVTDFDAISGSNAQEDLVAEIIRSAGIPVQLGGGFRSMERIADWIDRGVGRVVIGTMAVRNPALVKEAAKFYPDQIVLAVDVYQGKVMTDGWKQPSAYDPVEFIEQFENDPLAAMIISDIDAEADENEAPLALVTEIAGIAKAPVISRGIARSLDDLARLKYTPYLSGAILGRALFDRSVALEDALALARPDPKEEKAQLI